MDRPKFADLTGVRWTIPSINSERVLTKDDLSALGLGDLGVEELRWNAANEYTVPVTLLDAHAVDTLIGLGSEFEAV